MTRERRQDLAFGALAVSIAVHIAVMVLVKSEVMTRIPGDGARSRRLQTMRITEAPEPAAVSGMEEAGDRSPAKSAPAPEKDAPSPALDAFSPVEAPAAVAEAPSAMNRKDDIPVPAVETLPKFSGEKTKIDHGRPVQDPGMLPVSAPVHAAGRAAPPEAAAAARPSDALAMALFEPAAPVARDFGEIGMDPFLPDDRPDLAGRDFDAGTEVMDRVDEKVVALEKTAVKTLLDDRNASEFSKVAAVGLVRETEGEWTYFKVKIVPSASLSAVPKDVVILMDASGSIGSDRLRSCRAAVRSILRSCANTGDRFNLVAFRDRFSYAFKTWRECDSVSFEAADRWLSRLAAFGRTDVFATIRSVLALPRDPQRPLIALVVTDGDANSGVSRTSSILSRFTELNDGLVSIYMYGVKGSANRELIDMLTAGNRGESFIFDGERASAGGYLENLGRRFRDPVVTDPRVVFASGIEVQTYPRLLKNLYAGSSVEFAGRVPASARSVSFSIKGLRGANAFEGFYSFDLAAAPAAPGVADAWRKGEAVERKLRR